MDNTKINRRQFLKAFGGGVVAASAILAGCSSKGNQSLQGTATGDVPTDKMTYRTDLHGQQVSLLGYGCMRFPTIAGVSGREDRNSELDQEQINRLIDYAIEHGVNLFDTSPAYCQGKSETALGIALSRHKRSEYLVSTKLSNFGNNSREATMEMYLNSMRELQVDYIDYYLLHGVGNQATLESRYLQNGMLDFLLEERKAGRIRNLGFSFHGDKTGFDYMMKMHDIYHWDFVLIQHNYVDWHNAKTMNPRNINSEYLYAELEKRNIPVFVMEPLMGGRLANMNDHATALLKQHDPNASVASWAFRFAGSQPRILSVLSGMTYMEHLQDNLRTYSPLKPLSDEEYQLLDKIATQYATFPMVPCNTCQYCMPCPYGLDIPGIFSHYNKCINEGNVQENRQSAEYKRARQAFLVGYDRSVPRLRQASHCTSCNQCVSHCPQHINIPREMQRIDNFVENLKRDGADLGTASVLAALSRQLDEGRYSCVVYKDGETRVYTQRGVLDLFQMVNEKSEFLNGAMMADKIVGKGAASLMILGGVKAVRTKIICTSALQMLKGNGVKVYYDEEVDHIINNSKTDWCPLEKRVKDAASANDCWPIVQQFVSDLKAGLI